MARKQKVSKFQKSYSFKVWQIAVFVVVFGSMGVYSLLQSSAAPKRDGNITSGKYPATVEVKLVPILDSQYGEGFSHLTATGCGYTTNAYLTYLSYRPSTTYDGTLSTITQVDGNGCLAYSEPDHMQHKLDPGTYIVEVQQRATPDSRFKTMAKNTFVVQ